MDAETFLDNFSTIAEAPEGVQRLRDLVLDLAVTGRLVDQDPGDQPATVGLRSVRAEKGSTLATSIRGGASTPRVPTDPECAGQPPKGWSMARLDDTGEYVNGLAFKNSDWKPAGIPIIRIQNLTNSAVPFNYAAGPFPEDRMAHDGDILVSWSATLEAFRWNRGDGVVNQHIFKVIPDERVVTTSYLFHLLRHSIRVMAESQSAHGLVMKHINRGPFLSYVAAIPPLAEQERIVAKVHDLMSLCDDLDTRQQYRRHITNRFRGSALDALVETEISDDLQLAWDRTSINWPVITDHAGAIAEIRQAILQLAIRGCLVSQDEADGSAGAELLRARATKASMLGLRTQASLPSVETPSRLLPSGWTWATVDDLFLVSGGIQKSSRRRPRENHWPYLRVANVQRGRLDLREIERFELFDGELDRLRLEPGDLLVVEGNGSEFEIGRCARWDGEIDDCVHQNHLIRCRPMLSDVEHYVLLFFNSPVGMQTMKNLSVTTSGLYNLSVAKIRAVPFPLPPLAEQVRIRRKADELMRRCDRLAGRLDVQERASKLYAASSIDALAP